MFLYQTRQLNSDQLAILHDGFAMDVALVDSGGGDEEHGCDWILKRPRVLQTIEGDRDEVGRFAGLERSDVIAAEHGGRTTRRDSKRFPGREEATTLDRRRCREARKQHRLSGLADQVAAVVARRAVHTESESNVGCQVAANRSDTGREAHIR